MCLSVIVLCEKFCAELYMKVEKCITKSSFLSETKILGFYYFLLRLIQSKRIILDIIYNQIIQHRNSITKNEMATL